MTKQTALSIGIVGMGKMGEAIVQGLKNSGHGAEFPTLGTTKSRESADDVSARVGIACGTDNLKLAEACDVLILCIKPHQVEKVLLEIAPKLAKKHLLISIAASITLKQLSEWSGGKCPVIRAMPNTPCLIGEGMTVFSAAESVKPEQLEIARQIFGTVGKTTVAEDSLMDGVTGLSGCGPAYIYLVIEALSEAGVKVGLSRETSTLLAAQTLVGAAKMVLERGVHPAALKDEVTTPAGCTIDGLMALEEGKLRVTLIKAVLAATKRSKRLRASK
jgi:pyrroline-5-carboxylate reductase